MNQKQPQQQGQKRILAVDDEPDLNKLCSLALEYHGFKVDTFNDPQEALSSYKSDYYDLVILDIKMPYGASRNHTGPCCPFAHFSGV